jgi:hypothetical protein
MNEQSSHLVHDSRLLTEYRGIIKSTSKGLSFFLLVTILFGYTISCREHLMASQFNSIHSSTFGRICNSSIFGHSLALTFTCMICMTRVTCNAMHVNAMSWINNGPQWYYCTSDNLRRNLRPNASKTHPKPKRKLRRKSRSMPVSISVNSRFASHPASSSRPRSDESNESLCLRKFVRRFRPQFQNLSFPRKPSSDNAVNLTQG